MGKKKSEKRSRKAMIIAYEEPLIWESDITMEDLYELPRRACLTRPEKDWKTLTTRINKDILVVDSSIGETITDHCIQVVVFHADFTKNPDLHHQLMQCLASSTEKYYGHNSTYRQRHAGRKREDNKSIHLTICQRHGAKNPFIPTEVTQEEEGSYG
ncbi:hypothetical protein BC829DRAFT_419453 [Chytridium lagenaria]|nr:hypothetical protein BC829DRAFT_419453 [Chytridium lagenaria]